ncbi:MAG: hypothetical protein IK089_07915, partial [Oxalobacter sp.]|nr:hypothetical protein [Oxalobacter sp.]
VDILFLPVCFGVAVAIALTRILTGADAGSRSFWDNEIIFPTFFAVLILFVLISRAVHRLRLVLGPGFTIVVPKRPLKLEEEFTVTCMRFGHAMHFTQQEIFLVNTREIHHAGKLANPHVPDGRNPDMIGYITEKEGFRQLLASGNDLDSAVPVVLPCRIPRLLHGQIDNSRWAIRVKCVKGNCYIFQEDTPLNINFLVD